MTQFQYFFTDHESYPSTVPFIFTFTAVLRKSNFSVLIKFQCPRQTEFWDVTYRMKQ